MGKKIFSGVQPTGNLHLGNYLGAIKNWVNLQKEKSCIFCIVDLHAITVPENRFKLKENTLEVAAAYISSGIDPQKSKIFIQSNVSGHSELAWILSCHTPIGWLNRMTQFKDKAGKNKENVSVGLFTYPVLMAADILLYKATHVPVGEDQKQHLELTRDIALKFNNDFNKEVFPLPEPIIMKKAARIMSLRDASKKMSKSDTSDFSRISLTDSNEEIEKKIKKAKTDALPIPDSNRSLEDMPEAKNLLTIFSACEEEDFEKTFDKFKGKNFSELKKDSIDLKKY